MDNGSISLKEDLTDKILKYNGPQPFKMRS